jgi:hypothetical protein
MTEASSPNPQVDRLPLRLCEVLEREYAAIHGSGAPAGDWRLAVDDVDYPRLVELFASPSRSPATPAIDAIRRRLSAGGLDPNALPPAADLVAALNAELAAQDELFDRTLLDDDNEARRVANVVARMRRRSPDHPDVARACLTRNRLLLEAAIPPEAIARADTVRLDQLFKTVHAADSGITSALCLSGGGIRSASFALGVLQGLARCGALAKFDYLSTVSGGGYIGSWLSTWTQRHPGGLSGVIADLRSHATPEAGGLQRKLRPEPGALRFLRSYSHFLNPRAGLFTVDTWSWIGIYLRNLTLNWLALIPLLFLIVALPRAYAGLLYNSEYAHGDAFPWLFWAATLAMIMTLVCVTVNRPTISDPALPSEPPDASAQASIGRRWRHRLKQQNAVLALGVLPASVFAILLTLVFWGLVRSKQPFTWTQIAALLDGAPLTQWPTLLPYIGLEHLLLWGELGVVVAWVAANFMTPARDLGKRVRELVAMLAAGLFAWGAIAALAGYASTISTTPGAHLAFDIALTEAGASHAYAILAVPVVVLATLLGMTLFIGGVSKFKWIDDEDREWWARFGAWLLIVIVGWMVLAALAVLGPVVLLESPRLAAGVGGLSGLLAALVGKSSLIAARGQAGAPQPFRAHDILRGLGTRLLVLGALLFFAVFLALLSLLTSAALKPLLHAWHDWFPPGQETGTWHDLLRAPRAFTHGCGGGEPWDRWWAQSVFEDPRLHLEIACQTPFPLVALLIAALAAVVLLASLFINLNKFSLHAAYRMRIVRTFLGASRRNDRRPNAFTGFDPQDNLQMHELQPGLLREADVLDLQGLVERFRRVPKSNTAPDPVVDFLATQIFTPANDPERVLESRLRHSNPEGPVLKSVERDLVQAINRVLETVPLAAEAPFASVVAKVPREQYGRYRDQGNLIFGNRLLLEAALGPSVIRPYEFPPPPPHKLVHVLNLTLNLVRGRRLAWQERKAAPFTVTPMHSGSYYLGFRASREYGGKDGIAIGTAAAISGAAVSPNMGYASSPVMALLLTLFNVRLGWWLGNPGIAGQDTYRLAEPRFSLRPLVSEALGLTDDRSPYVYLSDGGHFENLGLFEMVLRRCRLIVVSDAGADPDYEFEDLGNAVRKVRIDLGIPIEFGSIAIRRRGKERDRDARYCALGRIRYSVIDGPNAPDGVLLLLKPALLDGEPRDVANYAAQAPRFPQEPTSDQFFGEAQFESYRQLGEFETRTVCGAGEFASYREPWAAVFVRRALRHLGGTPEPWLDAWLTGLPKPRTTGSP